MSRQGAGTSVPAPLAYPAACRAGLLVVPLVFRAPEGPAAVCAGGRRPAREPSAPRASLGASPRSPARPRHRPPAPRPARYPFVPARSPHASFARSGRSRSPPVPSGPSGALHTSGAWCVDGRGASSCGPASPPPTGASGDSRETVITFAGACSVSSETDGTIARQKHPFLMLCLRAKASRVSWWHHEAPALVPAVSHNGRASSFGAKSSPCSAWCGRKREKVRPAYEKWPKNGVIWRAGRVFSRA